VCKHFARSKEKGRVFSETKHSRERSTLPISKSMPNVDWVNQMESEIRQFAKEKLELIMREEIKSH
jgi:hypothetical protein